jgi:hypothetical protein
MERMETDTMDRWACEVRASAEAFKALAQACSDARAAWELERWYRFDTLYGPLIGGAVILGTLAIAALAAYAGG